MSGKLKFTVVYASINKTSNKSSSIKIIQVFTLKKPLNNRSSYSDKIYSSLAKALSVYSAQECNVALQCTIVIISTVFDSDI